MKQFIESSFFQIENRIKKRNIICKLKPTMFELLVLGLHSLKVKYANKLSYLNEIQLGIQHVFQSLYNGSKVRHNGANASLHVLSSVYLFHFLTQTAITRNLLKTVRTHLFLHSRHEMTNVFED